MTPTPETTREQAVSTLREVCREIGCSGLDPKMCKERPHQCAIIRRLLRPKAVAALAGEET